MSWVDITDGEIDPLSGNTTTLWNRIKGNLDYLKTQSSSFPQMAHGVFLRSHVDSDQEATKVSLVMANAIITNDGSVDIITTPGLTASTGVSGAGGIDTGSVTASRCYEVHYIRTDAGVQNLLLHKAARLTLDVSGNTTTDGIRGLYDANTRQYLAQSFATSGSGAGKVYGIEIECYYVGTNTSNMYMELRADNGGVPAAGVLATSYVQPISTLNSVAGQWVRFIFPTPYTVANSTTYWIVLKKSTDTLDGTNYFAWRVASAGTGMYAWDNTAGPPAWASLSDGASFKVYTLVDEASITMPATYTSSCLVGYAFTDGSSNLYAFAQMNKSYRFICDLDDWRIVTSLANAAYTTVGTLNLLPVRPLAALVRAGNNSTNLYVKVSGVLQPFRYGSAFAETESGAERYLGMTAAYDRPVYEMGKIYTEQPAFYARNVTGGSTVTLYCVGFEYL